MHTRGLTTPHASPHHMHTRDLTTPTAATLLLTSRHRDCAGLSSQVPIEAGMEAGIEYVGCRRTGNAWCPLLMWEGVEQCRRRRRARRLDLAWAVVCDIVPPGPVPVVGGAPLSAPPPVRHGAVGVKCCEPQGTKYGTEPQWLPQRYQNGTEHPDMEQSTHVVAVRPIWNRAPMWLQSDRFAEHW